MKIIGTIKLKIAAGKANAMPPIGPALGQKGINIMKFCKHFNEKTKQENESLKLIVKVYIYKDKSYTLSIHKPSTTDIIKEQINLKKGSINPNREKCATISIKEIENIARKKIADMNTNNLKVAIRIIKGITKSYDDPF